MDWFGLPPPFARWPDRPTGQVILFTDQSKLLIGPEVRDIELEVKTMIIEALVLEDLSPAEIDPEEPLFGDGLGLDSIDALELGVAIRRQYGIHIEAVNDEVKAHFASVRSLARFIETQRGK